MTWFTGVTDIQTLRQRYRELLREYHPDNGGNVSDMQNINAEYDVLFDALSKADKSDKQSYTHEEQAENEAFKDVLNRIIHINADIEIIGSWVWVHGAYAYKELLKSIGFRYAPKKKSWCWHYGEYKRHHKAEISLDELRLRYGSQSVNHKSKQYALN